MSIKLESLKDWFSKSHPDGGWKRINSKGEAIGPCAREPGEPKPKCMSNKKRAQLSKKERASAVAAKRRHDPNPERKGKPINVSNFGKGKISEMTEFDEESKPTNPELWARAKTMARQKFDVYPSAYANGWAVKWYKSKGGGWRSTKEEVEEAANAAQQAAIAIDMKKKGIKPKNEQLEEKYGKGYKSPADKIAAAAKRMGRPNPLEGMEKAALAIRKDIEDAKNKNVKKEELEVDEACWDGYKKQGMKKKGNRMVPNCVPEENTLFRVVKQVVIENVSKRTKNIKENAPANNAGAGAVRGLGYVTGNPGGQDVDTTDYVAGNISDSDQVNNLLLQYVKRYHSNLHHKKHK